MFGPKARFVPPAGTSPGFLELIAGYSDKHKSELFRWCGRHGGDPPDKMLNPPAERYLAAITMQRHWETDTREYTGYGNIFLTNERLLWRSGSGNLEIPLAELKMSGWHAEYGKRLTRLKISVAPGTDPYEFWLYDWKPPAFPVFEAALEAAVRDAAKRRANAQEASVVSVADELAKFAALRDQGVITEGEFAAKKRDLLG